MKFTVAAAIALALALAATTASAGVVISQDVVVTNQAGEHKSEQTVMIQGHKQKVITSERETVIDLDAGKMYIMRPSVKQYVEVSFPPKGMFARMTAREGMFVGIKKTDVSRTVAGYKCTEYSGSEQISFSDITSNECVAADAPGAKEFVAFREAMEAKLKDTGLAAKQPVPDGVPVSSQLTLAQKPFQPPRGMPEKQAKMMEAGMAKYKPTVSTITVSKIEVKDLPADTFVVPADYNKREMVMPHMMQSPAKGAAPGTPPAAPAKPAAD